MSHDHPIDHGYGYGWYLDAGRVEFARALAWQRQLVKMRIDGMCRDLILLVEHPPVVTVGKDGHAEHYASAGIEPVAIERGGDVTYHGPGQLVVYFIFNLTRRGRDLHAFIDNVQEGIIRSLAEYGVEGYRNDVSTGVWVGDAKLASIGVAVKKWISFHGAAINLNTNLDEFASINPCGLKPETMTSLAKLRGKSVALSEFSRKLIGHYADVFATDFSPVLLEEIAEDLKSQTGGGHV